HSYLHLDTSPHATAAGFWHLHEKEPAKATEAFSVVRSLLYGEEMYTLAYTLTLCTQAENAQDIAQLQLPSFPKENLLRPTTWEALNALQRVVEDTQLVHHSLSRTTRSLALNRAQGELKHLLDNADSLPEAERELIYDIAQTWQDALLNIASEVGEIEITQPVTIPYVIGDPVEGKLFVGREDICRELESLWIGSDIPSSVVLFGHRRMGKTSILRNMAAHSGAEVQVIYINLQRLGAISQGVGEVLMAITDELAETLNLDPPTDNDLLTLPKRTFERYLKTILKQLGEKRLIIALDEFEILETLIEAGQIPSDFLGFLRGMVQLSPKIAFAFAGLHTLEEMTADYFQPFYASVIPLHVSFLKPAATRQILANPDDDFPLDYTGEALDFIHNLTAGQPFLVQLVGFQLVRRYNEQVFEEGRQRDVRFTVEDVEAVINHPDFFRQGRYYFEGVWKQAADGATGQRDILQVLATEREGLTLETLTQRLSFETATVQEALKTLQRHDVVQEQGGNWRIIVELFRRWVAQRE
ncbi:MAG: AAA family ATPase, partial [Kamptonema sp. SIO4C4]|nr:AAA family ATPase [Kamptonema sp. SIO4C4]